MCHASPDHSYPIGNQLYLQTAETLLWYGDYLEVAEQRSRIPAARRIGHYNSNSKELARQFYSNHHRKIGNSRSIPGYGACSMRPSLTIYGLKVEPIPKKQLSGMSMHFVHAGARQLRRWRGQSSGQAT